MKLACPDELIAGVDEAGRGPLAGPVTAAAVILDPTALPAGLDDSKKLSASRRATLADEIRAGALAWSIATADPAEIDAVNVLRASLLAMRRALLGLNWPPIAAWVDGPHAPSIRHPGGAPPAAASVRAVVRGDAKFQAIAAASILAKVARDAWMLRLHERFPMYGFDRHKGYPTRQHMDALTTHGPCPVHRYTFAPVSRLCQEFSR